MGFRNETLTSTAGLGQVHQNLCFFTFNTGKLTTAYLKFLTKHRRLCRAPLIIKQNYKNLTALSM